MAGAELRLPKLDVRALPGPETVLRKECSNGMVVLARENFSSPSVVLTGLLRVGSLDEPAEKAGLADMTAQCLMYGTRRRAFREIYESIESIGARLSLTAGKHTTVVSGKGLAEDLGDVLDLLAEVLFDPTFPRQEVDRLRAQKLTAIQIRDQDTGARAHQAFSELLYPDHPYSQPTLGFQDTVAPLKGADLRAFHRRHYGPRGMILCVVGAVEAQAALAAVEKRFGTWANARRAEQPELPAVAQPRAMSRKAVILPGKSQSDLVLGAIGPSRRFPEYLAAALGNNILGRFGMMGRIGQAVREEAGLAYYAYSTVRGGPGPGPWEIIVGVHPANVEQAVALVQAEIRRFVERRVLTAELQENQANFIGRLPLQVESNEGVAAALLHIERYNLGLDYYQRYPDLVAGVTRDQIRAVARRFLDPDRLAIGLAGPDHQGE